MSNIVPSQYDLLQNFPNPFNPVTKIKFELAKSNLVSLTIYDNLGREVTTLIKEQLEAGIYEVEWNAANYSSGIYYYSINSTDFTATKKMILAK